MGKSKADYYFIKKWKKQQAETIKLVHPEIDDKELDKFLTKHIEERFKDTGCIVSNNHRGKSVNSSLLNIIEFIHDTKPITAGFGVLFKNQNECYNPDAEMLRYVLDQRKKVKAERKKFLDNPYEYLVRDLKQLNLKLIANSFYGANGSKTSVFYNEYTAASTTSSGHALISTTETSYEQLLSNNAKFLDMDEMMLFVYRVCKKTKYKYFELIPKIDDIRERALEWVLGSFKFPDKIDLKLVNQIFENLSDDDCTKLYFKNNFDAFLTEIPAVFNLVSHLVNDTPSFTNPNKPPEEIIPDLQLLWDYCLDIVCHNYPIRMRIDRDKYHKRRSVIAQDTDSTMITINHIIETIVKNHLSDEPAAEDEEGLTYIMVNTIAFILSRWSETFLARYCRDVNIPEEYQPILNLKNEFYYPMFLATEKKKRYITKCKLQEGDIIDPPKIDIHGLEIIKAEMASKSSDFFQKLIKEEIMDAEQIDVSKIIRKLKGFENTIKDSIHAGELDYLSLKAVKEPEAYSDPLKEMGIKAVNAWNYIYPEMTIQLPAKVLIVKIRAAKRAQFDEMEGRIPPDKFEIIKEKIFNNPEPRVIKAGFAVVALPQNIGKIPDWIANIADVDTIVFDNVSKFNPILISLGTIPLKTTSQNKHMSNIIDL